jgi:hypothetical protein
LPDLITLTDEQFDLFADNVREIITEITSIQIEDGMTFEVKSVHPIMDEADYHGVRVMMETDSGLMALWSNYRRKFDYAANIDWEMVMSAIMRLAKIVI